MAEPTVSPAAGGCLIAAGVTIGAAIGFFASQPSLGVLIGGASGAAMAGLIWWRGRARG